MPRAAIGTGSVDMILPVQDVLHRLSRRMQFLGITEAPDYVNHIAENPDEAKLLRDSFLIGVTSFFRDRECFESLQRNAIAPLLEQISGSRELRVWVPACSTGQEAYSLAMLIDETSKSLGLAPRFQIFASDINEKAIEQARAAEFPDFSRDAFSARHLQDYVTEVGGALRISDRIADTVRFSYHNLLVDPPFSKLDLISCRNRLIYLNDDFQTELHKLLHFALNKGGDLFLGSTESIRKDSPMFSTVDRRAHIFQAQTLPNRTRFRMPLATPGQVKSPGGAAAEKLDGAEAGAATPAEGKHLIHNLYAPPFVRVTRDLNVIDSSGDLGLFMLSRPGEEQRFDLLARPGIRETVSPLIRDALADGRVMSLKDLKITSPFGVQTADIVVHPMAENCAAVVFLARGQLDALVEDTVVPTPSLDRRVEQLEADLENAQVALRRKVEETDTTSEELKSSNEEMMSINEEIQSINEELTTTNQELKNKVEELTLANNDLDKFVRSADLAMIVLDRTLSIRHVTLAASSFLPLSAADRGRPLEQFSFGLDGLDLVEQARKVFQAGAAHEATGRDPKTERSYLVRIFPYHGETDSSDGVVITIIDLTAELKLRNDLAVESKRLRLAMESGRIGLAELDVEADEITIDTVLASQHGLDAGGLVTREILTRYIIPDDMKIIEEAMAEAIEQGSHYEVVYRVYLPGQGIRWIRTNGTRYLADNGRLKIVGANVDITEENARERREVLISELNHRVKNLFAVIGGLIEGAPAKTPEVVAFADQFADRVEALGKIYGLVRRSGDLSSATLDEMLKSVLEPHSMGQRMDITGPEVTVASGSINTMTLVLHELTTNAVKYGALSHPQGQLDVSWERSEDDRVRLMWRETVPGFKRAAASDTGGFGSHLIEMALRQLNGEHRRTFGPAGLDLDLSFQL